MFKKWCNCETPSIVGASKICGVCYKEIDQARLMETSKVSMNSPKDNSVQEEFRLADVLEAEPESRMRTSDCAPMSVGLKSTNIAIESAKIVNAWGSAIQVIGIFVGLIYVGVGWYFGKQIDNVLVGIVLGTLVGSIVIAVAAFQGALLRMISNYIIAKLDYN